MAAFRFLSRFFLLLLFVQPVLAGAQKIDTPAGRSELRQRDHSPLHLELDLHSAIRLADAGSPTRQNAVPELFTVPGAVPPPDDVVVNKALRDPVWPKRYLFHHFPTHHFW